MGRWWFYRHVSKGPQCYFKGIRLGFSSLLRISYIQHSSIKMNFLQILQFNWKKDNIAFTWRTVATILISLMARFTADKIVFIIAYNECCICLGAGGHIQHINTWWPCLEGSDFTLWQQRKIITITTGINTVIKSEESGAKFYVLEWCNSCI